MSRDPLHSALGKKSKADLIAWILDLADSSEDAERALRAWASPQVEVGELVPALHKQITATWAKVKRSRNAHRMASATAADLEHVLAGIESVLERGNASAAESLLRRFLEACEPAAGQIDDSYGRLWPVLQHGVALWGRSWASLAPKDLGPLAAMVSDRVTAHKSGEITDPLIHHHTTWSFSYRGVPEDAR